MYKGDGVEKFEGNLSIGKSKYEKHTMINGFTKNDMKMLQTIARKFYKIKTSKKRILKKYAKRLLNEALRSKLLRP